VKSNWNKNTNLAKTEKKVLTVATSQELNEELSRDIDKIDMIQKNLDKYLTMKKTNFARLYFLSDDELLKILSNTKDPRNVNDYLRKIFENMD
jgi:dynein heavy chain